MELIDADELLEFLHTLKDNFFKNAVNINDPVVSIKLYAMAHGTDMIIEKVLEGNFDIDTPNKEDMN